MNHFKKRERMFLGTLLEKINTFAKQAIKLINGDRLEYSHHREEAPQPEEDMDTDEQEVEEENELDMDDDLSDTDTDTEIEEDSNDDTRFDNSLDIAHALQSEYSMAGFSDLILQKIRLCNLTLDALVTTNTKLATLRGLLLFANGCQLELTVEMNDEFVRMIASNILRTFPPNQMMRHKLAVQDTGQDKSWTQLDIIYSIFLSILGRVDFKSGLINRKFVAQLLKLFDSWDARERSYLKRILVQLYNKYGDLRHFIRQQIYNIFYQFIYMAESFNGIGELLWVHTIFLDVPSSENTDYLFKILLPLHKVSNLAPFHNQLKQSIVQFLVRDTNHIEKVIRGLLKLWPKISAMKEILFLDELGAYLNLINLEQFGIVLRPLIAQLAKCVVSSHIEVVEHALDILGNKYVISLIEPNADVIMPVMCPALMSITKGHWNQSLLRRAFNILQVLVELDTTVFNSLLITLINEKKRLKQQQKNREKAWQKVHELAQARIEAIHSECKKN